jgi:hypothetical protein
MSKHNLRRSALASTLCSLALAYACAEAKSGGTSGTETDNPVVDTSSPSLFAPAQGTPPCAPPDAAEVPSFPDALPHSVMVPTAQGSVLAVADDGLTLMDVSDPAHAVTLSQRSVRGRVVQLLLSTSGKLWVAALEAPELDPNRPLDAADLQSHLRVILLDVNDPTAPVRLAQAELGEDDFWQLQERGDQLWALSARKAAQERSCDARPKFCRGPAYEAVTLRGFRQNAGTLEPVGEAELPFERRVWWNGDGVATALADGTLHVARWNNNGVLTPALTLTMPESEAFPGPVQIDGAELSVVSVAAGQASLHRYDLTSSASAPGGSFPLGELAKGLDVDVSAGVFSLFSKGFLWLQPPESTPDPMQVWDVSGAVPAQISLPAPFVSVLPIEGATRDGASDEVLAIGVTRDGVGSQNASLLSLREGNVSSLGAAPQGAEYIPYSNRGKPIPAPMGLHGSGDASDWDLLVRGPGLPIGIDPIPPRQLAVRRVSFSVAAQPAGGAALAVASLVDNWILPNPSNAFQPNPTLEVTRGAASASLELPPGASTLLSVGTAVVAVATADGTDCESSGRDCSRYSPGVAVFDLSDEPRLAGELPFPKLPLPATTETNYSFVTWNIYPSLPLGSQQIALPLDDRRLAFVADVDLSCNTNKDCAALGIAAVPIDQTGGLTTVFGSGHRQYFYVLELDDGGSPTWQPWGVSKLAATAALTDQSSYFAAPFASSGALAATRLEHRRPSGSPLEDGTARFMLDRFELNAAGKPISLPPVNVPGYPVAKLGGDSSSERWISIEPEPDPTGRARVHRLEIRKDGARIERTLDMEASFSGFQALEVDERWLGLVLSSPANACGVTRLSALRLGTPNGDAEEVLEIASTLELPTNGWSFVTADENRALLRRDNVYTLAEVSADGTLSVVSSQSTDADLENEQLLGKSLFGGTYSSGSKRIDF